MHLISASRRTDLPAFYADWFMDRTRHQEAAWTHPYTGKAHRISLAPSEVVAIVFWSRNFAPMMGHLPELDGRGYRYLVHYTITALSPAYESHVPSLRAAVQQFQRLADQIGPQRTIWRYDPILISREHDFDFHIENFDQLSRELEGYTNQCILSFLQVYGKVQKNLQNHRLALPDPSDEERRALARELGEMAIRRGIRVKACCSDDLLGPEVGKARCVDLEQVRHSWPELTWSASRAPTRGQCGCTRAYDIGAYDTCLHGCVYCYATRSRQVAQSRYQRHDPKADTLVPIP